MSRNDRMLQWVVRFQVILAALMLGIYVGVLYMVDTLQEIRDPEVTVRFLSEPAPVDVSRETCLFKRIDHNSWKQVCS